MSGLADESRAEDPNRRCKASSGGNSRRPFGMARAACNIASRGCAYRRGSFLLCLERNNPLPRSARDVLPVGASDKFRTHTLCGNPA